jgi:glycosyltransferase involved in cell wall biosynthesis
MFYTLLLIGLARLLGYRCILQHHSYSYILRFDWRMKLIDTMLGKDGAHGVSCSDMGSRFRRTYGSTRKWFTMPNTFMMPNVETDGGQRPEASRGPMTVGHLSNLSFEKGIGDVLMLFSELRRKDLPVRLVLAGPSTSKKVEHLIRRAQEQFGDAVDYRGAVQGDDKWAFFKDIDLFLFPTRYRIEAQPVVIFEAISFGRPVIAFGRGCIPAMLNGHGGCVIDVHDDFVTKASPIIENWIARPSDFQSQRDRAWSRAVSLRASGEEGLFRLAKALNR